MSKKKIILSQSEQDQVNLLLKRKRTQPKNKTAGIEARNFNPKRKIKKEFNRFQKLMHRTRKMLNANPWPSEVWFWDIYAPYKDFDDQRNAIFAGKIPDLLNKKYKYIVEVDGSIHDKEDVKAKDLKKEQLYKRCGYHVFRVKHNDTESFQKALNQILMLRERK